MRSQQMKIRWMIAAVAAALVAATTAPLAGARPTAGPAEPAEKIAEQFIPGVTDSTTGVLRELEQRRRDREPFIPGVTDFGTGVPRELERNGVEPSGLGWDDSATGATATLAAAIAAASLALALRGRRRRLAT